MAYSNVYARFHAIFNKSKASFGEIFRFRPSLVYIALIVLGQALAWLQAWFINRNLSGDILVLHYNVDFGIDLVGDPSRIYIYPLLGLLVFVINLLVLAILYKDKNFKVLVHFLLGAAAIFGLFLILALLAVYLINFR